MGKELKEIPTFQSEEEEREFWTRADSTEYLAWDEAEEVIFSKLKPSIVAKKHTLSYIH
jgi:hypothetical protein